MKFVVTGSLGNISLPLTRKLLAEGHEVTVISSKHEKVELIEAMKAKAAIGSVTDLGFLSRVFSDADAVYTMVPPFFGAPDWKKYIADVGQNYAEAIKVSGVKNVVNLSSIGAHMPDGCGPVSGLFYVEKALNELRDVNVKHLRPGFFYTNLLANAGMAKQTGVIGGNYGEGATLTLVYPGDIAEVAAEEMLNLDFSGKSIRYIMSEEKTTNEIAAVLGKAIGKPDLTWVNFSDEQTIGGMLQAGAPEEIARNYAEMGGAIRSGEMISDYLKNKPSVFGKTKLESWAPVFASAYQQA
ncbi:MAG TPA: NAD(P)H-binding protein [Prolixibacteraceae bacterium]|nr:NAD(P)H-binding protein [Prolixibacteraceae bacterium]HPR86155.1 NAD(P)H-binding protein [Prolixibacteraceae bacterium]